MREIVHVQVGRCGNSIGKTFWEVIAAEHGLDRQGKFKPSASEFQKQRIDVYFAEGSDGRRVPRAVMVDFDHRSVQNAVSGYYGSLFKPHNVVCGRAGTNNNWAKGYYSEGADVLEQSLDVVRTEVEACDAIQGIQIVHALGGGTGSGFGSLLARHMMEEYSNRILKSYSLLPSSHDRIVVQAYNAVLTMPYLIDSVHEVFCMNNEAVSYICSDKLKMRSNFYQLNYLISLCMSGITACLRFPGQLNASLRKLMVNMVPYPRLHFFVPGYVPLIPEFVSPYVRLTVRTLIQEMFKSGSMLITCDPTKGLFLTAAAVFRGRISPKDVDESMYLLQNLYSSYYVEWIPHNIKTAICDVATYNTAISATSLSNTTAIQVSFTEVLNQFKKLFNNKAYLHWYTNEGMEESDFVEAQNKLLAIISEYQQYQKAS